MSIVLGMRSATSRCGPLSLWGKEVLVVGGDQEDQCMEDLDMEDLRWVRRMGRFLAHLGMARAEAQAGALILGGRVRKGCGSRSASKRTIFWRVIWMMIELIGSGLKTLAESKDDILHSTTIFWQYRGNNIVFRVAL
jgi:hypothetical protein